MMYASFCATLFGFTQASNEYSPVPCASSAIFWLDEVEACALPPAAKVRPQPPAHVTPLPQIVLDKKTVDQYHKPGSVDVSKLPPLVADNQFLEKSGVLQYVRKEAGL